MQINESSPARLTGVERNLRVRVRRLLGRVGADVEGRRLRASREVRALLTALARYLAAGSGRGKG
jgi:hypothetical protein